jgi:hypothetical protein
MHNLLASFDAESVLVDDVPSKDMHPVADDPKQNSCVGNSDVNNIQKKISENLVIKVSVIAS